MQLANVAAGIVVGKVGTVPVEKHELLAALSPNIALHAEDKVVSRAELVTRVALWKANGERVVFTNGCFDLLHVGHISLLEQAHSFGDRLIVAINSDASVSGLKGPTRPIVGETDRARVLAALAAVDAVCVFSEPDVYKRQRLDCAQEKPPGHRVRPVVDRTLSARPESDRIQAPSAGLCEALQPPRRLPCTWLDARKGGTSQGAPSRGLPDCRLQGQL